NGINIKIFAGLDLRNCVNVSFLILSISDFAYLLVDYIVFLLNILMVEGYRLSVEPISFIIYFLTFNRLFYDLSNTVTCFIAVTRCCCIVFPFRFKTVFTRSRTLTIIGIIYILFLSEYMPLIAYVGLDGVYNAVLNMTQTGIRYPPSRLAMVRVISDILNKNTLLLATFSVSLLCLVVIRNALSSASKFQSSLVTQSLNVPELSKSVHNSTGDPGRGLKSPKLLQSSSELRVIKGVSIVLIMSMLSHIPQMCLCYGKLIVPELSYGLRYGNWYVLINAIAMFVVEVNTSAKCFVYYRFNGRYRERLKSWFKLWSKMKK
ncbi:unnamed protein product, partial [Lymnaea stagnalis]